MVWFGRKDARASEQGALAVAAAMLDLQLAGAPRSMPKLVAATPSPATTYPLSDPDAWERLFGQPSDVVTAETARTQHVFYTCVSLIAGSIASMPVVSYKTIGKAREVDQGSAQARVLGASPNPRYSRVVFWRQIVADMLGNGNGVAWIERRGADPVGLWVIPWNRVGINFYRSPFGERRLLYHLVLDEGVHIEADQDDVLHFPGSPFWNIFYSVSPLTAYALTVGIALDSEKFARAYFKNGSAPDGFITMKGKLQGGSDQADEYRRRFMERFGKDNRFMGPAVLDNEAQYVPIRINAVDSQLLETRQLNALEIARVFHVPPHLINIFDKVQAFGKGLEELSQGFLNYALAPHIDAVETELKRKLYPPNSSRMAVFDRESLLRGDLKSRNEANQMALGGAQGPGWKSVNEVRVADGYAPLDGEEYEKPLRWGASAPQRPDSGRARPDPAAPEGPRGPSHE